MIIRLTESYVVNDNDEVTITVTVGQGQKGNTEMFFEGKKLPCKSKCTLGTGKDLTGKSVRVISVVTDTSKHTNDTSVIYDLKGGKSPKQHKVSYTVKKERDTVDYIATFKFV